MLVLYSETIKKSEKNRLKDEGVVGRIHELDQEWIKGNLQYDKINAEINNIQKKIKDAYVTEKNGDNDAKDFINKIEPKSREIVLKERAIELTEIDALVFNIGNQIEDAVPIAKNDDGNVVARTHHGSEPPKDAPRGYAELMSTFTNEAGGDVVGHKNTPLRGNGTSFKRPQKVCNGFAYRERIQLCATSSDDEERGSRGDVRSQPSDFDDQLYKIERDMYLLTHQSC